VCVYKLPQTSKIKIWNWQAAQFLLGRATEQHVWDLVHLGELGKVSLTK
jgi:hypothetical protein